MLSRLLGPEAPHWPTLAATYLIGAGGALLAVLAGVPLPILTGSLVATGLAAIAGIRPFGRPVESPQRLRLWFVPIIGVSIGAAFRPDVLEGAADWWPSLIVLAAYVPFVHWLAFRAVMRSARTDRVTAYWGTVPGGLIESVAMGEASGADVAMLTMLQFLRLILTILLVPLAFSVMEGHAVGSAGGAAMPGAEHPLLPADIALLAGAAVVGAVLGLRLRLPAGQISGPILLSGLLHVTGLTQTVPPWWIVALAQGVIGVSLGVRFAGLPLSQLRAGLRLAAVNVALTVGVAFLAALALHTAFGLPKAAVFLAFAPGGLVEMGLIALSLNLSVVYVTAHHLLRIILAVAFARLAWARG